MNDIRLIEVSARDGLQNEPNAAQLSVMDKVAYIELLIDAGLTVIEAGSFVKASAVPAMANSLEVAQLLQPVQKKHPSVVFPYLVPNLKGLERAQAVGAKEIAVFLAVSEQFARHNINASSVDQSFTDIKPVIDSAIASGIRVRGYLSTIFGYMDMAFTPLVVAERAKQLLAMGCYEVSLGDTTGIGTKNMVQELIASLRSEHIPLEKVAMHFHDTFGNAIGNVDMSYDLGIRTFDASTGGLGGCPYAHSPKGNVAMEDVIAWAHSRHLACDVTNVEKLTKAADFIRQKLDKT